MSYSHLEFNAGGTINLLQELEDDARVILFLQAIRLVGTNGPGTTIVLPHARYHVTYPYHGSFEGQTTLAIDGIKGMKNLRPYYELTVIVDCAMSGNQIFVSTPTGTIPIANTNGLHARIGVRHEGPPRLLWSKSVDSFDF